MSPTLAAAAAAVSWVDARDVGVGVFGFALGVVAGVILSAAWGPVIRSRTRHTVTMTLDPRTRRRLLLLVVVLLLVNGALGVLLIVAQVRTEQGAQERAERAQELRDLVGCLVGYNEANQEALGARDVRSEQLRDAAFTLWTDLRETLDTRGDVENADLIVSIDEYRAALLRSDATQEEIPYPPADLCEAPTPPRG